MTLQKPGPTRSHYENSEQGFIMMITLIMIAAIISVIVIGVSLSSITALQSTDTTISGERGRYYAEGCMQEALIQLNMDNIYSGGTLSLSGASCVVVISGVGNSRTVTVNGDLNNFFSSLSAEVTLVPFAVTEWDN